MGKINGEEDFSDLFDDILQGRAGSSLNHRRLLMDARASLQQDCSPSSSPFSGGFLSPANGSPFLASVEETEYQMPSTHHRNGFWVDSESPESLLQKNINELRLDELNMSQALHRMRIGDGQNLRMRESGTDSNGPDDFGFCHPSLCNVVNYRPFEGLTRNSLCDYGGSQSYFDDSTDSAKMGYQMDMGNFQGSTVCENQPNASYYDYQERLNYLTGQRREQVSVHNRREVQFQNNGSSRQCLSNGFCGTQNTGVDPCRYCISNGFCGTQQNGVDPCTDRGVLSSRNLMQPKLGLRVDSENPLYHRDGSVGAMQPSLGPKNYAGGFEGFNAEESFIFQESILNYGVNGRSDRLRGQRKTSWSDAALQKVRERSFKTHPRLLPGGICENGQSPESCLPLILQPHSFPMAEFQGYIYFIAKDQQGCRFLQRIFEEGKCQDVDIIFKELINHIVELMMNPFGNYLVQKLLEVCNEEQRMQIVQMVTRETGQLVKISLNTHGTRSVQKLIETLKGREQISLVIKALEPGFLDLIKDLNGNHVVQRCLQCFTNEDNKFIFDAAAKFCVDIATHRHGCCVLQRCISHSSGENQQKLVSRIAKNGLLLAQDAFGNYVVQYIIEQKIPPAAAKLVVHFKGNYVQLSTQKFSSHVVEKCIKFIEESRSQIVTELISVPRFEQLLQDQYANYVIQSALEVTKGALRALLVEAVRPHTILRTSPYCKRIFSRNLLKK